MVAYHKLPIMRLTCIIKPVSFLFFSFFFSKSPDFSFVLREFSMHFHSLTKNESRVTVTCKNHN